MPSNRAMPLDTRSVDASWSRPSEEIGRTEIPWSSMRNGYSFVPWVDPRYLMMRRRRVEISSRIRWSSRITQSETNSSMPCRVSLSGWSRSAVMTVVNPFCLSQLNRRRISARRIPGFGNSPKSASMVSRTTRRPNPLDCVGNSNEEAIEVVLAGFPKLASRDGHVVHEEFLVRNEPVQVETQRSDILSQVWD